jgi:aminoglycoside phosphotransferase
VEVQAAVCKYLKEEIFPQLASPPYGKVEAINLSSKRLVYLFSEHKRNIMVIGKFFGVESIPLEEAWLEADKEYLNLKLLRERFGMSGDTDYVVAPLGRSKELSALLVMEKAPGRTLDYYIARAIYEQQRNELFEKLSHLARFFVRLHQISETNRIVPPDLPQAYLQKLLNYLRQELLDPFEEAAIEQYSSQWWNEESIFVADREVIVHGDATPTNFLFDGNMVVGIDLEEMKWADRCWDLGFIAAELKHHFMWRMGDGWAAEPFIGHFLWEYAVNYGDTQFFHIITQKVPLYMALGLLRIARNSWLSEHHRTNLIKEAEQCLKYGQSFLTATVP